MTIDGSIESFSPFHNINCPKGFLYFNKQVQELFVLFYFYTLLDCTRLTFCPQSFMNINVEILKSLEILFFFLHTLRKQTTEEGV